MVKEDESLNDLIAILPSSLTIRVRGIILHNLVVDDSRLVCFGPIFVETPQIVGDGKLRVACMYLVTVGLVIILANGFRQIITGLNGTAVKLFSLIQIT